jgi:hypothetical protein
MTINPDSKEQKRSQVAQALHQFESAHKEDLEAIVQVLVKITNRPAQEIKPHLDTMLEQLVEPKERPFYETATPQEWVHAFPEWVESHRGLNLPLLSDEAIGRESIYGERG